MKQDFEEAPERESWGRGATTEGGNSQWNGLSMHSGPRVLEGINFDLSGAQEDAQRRQRM